MEPDTIINTVLLALAGGYGVLWKFVTARFKELKRAEERCEERNRQQGAEILKLTADVHELKGANDLAKKIAPDLEAIRKEIEKARCPHLNQSGF